MSFEANYGKGPRFTVSDRRRLIADEGGGAEAAQLLDEGVGAHPSARRVDERSGALRGPGRRSLLAACSISMLCGATFPRTANALSHSQVRKDPRMATAALSTRVLSVEHVTIQSRNGFDAVKTKLEALLRGSTMGSSSSCDTVKASAPYGSWRLRRLCRSSASEIMVRC
jgi:hypothetical protein